MNTANDILSGMPGLLNAAFPRADGEQIKGWVGRIAVAIGVKESYAKRLHYGEVQAVPAHVLMTLQRIAETNTRTGERNLANRRNTDSPNASIVPDVGCAEVVFRKRVMVRVGSATALVRCERLDGAECLSAAQQDPRQLSLPW